MFKKSDNENFIKLLKGVYLQNLTHGTMSHSTHFKLEKGAQIPPHNHNHEQTGCLISGHITLTVNGVEFDARPGDAWTIPSDVQHSAYAHEETLIIEVFSPPREDYLSQ